VHICVYLQQYTTVNEKNLTFQTEYQLMYRNVERKDDDKSGYWWQNYTRCQGR